MADDVTVYMAHGAWKGLDRTYPIQATMTYSIAELKLAEQQEHEMIDGKRPIGSIPYSDATRFGLDILNLPETLKKLVEEGKTVVETDGNCEGWGLSLTSIQEAVVLCTITVEKYAKKKEEEAITWQENRDKLIQAIKAIPPEKLERDVYYYFKQDYNYRHMHETFSGSTPLKKVVQYAIAFLGDEDEKNILPEEEYWDWSELFSEQNDAVLSLLHDGEVITTGEIGYHALSIVSEDEAKELAKKAFVEEEF